MVGEKHRKSGRVTARSGDKQREGNDGGKERKRRGKEGYGRGQYQCAEHMTDALGLLLNGFPVGRS